jgi:hypothetical protein
MSTQTAQKEAKPEGMERWSSGDHRSGLNFGGGGRRREIRRREVQSVGLGLYDARGLRLIFLIHAI